MNKMLSTIQSIREAADRAESIVKAQESALNDHSPLQNDNDLIRELNSLKRQWHCEARLITFAADHMLGINSTNEKE